MDELEVPASEEEPCRWPLRGVAGAGGRPSMPRKGDNSRTDARSHSAMTSVLVRATKPAGPDDVWPAKLHLEPSESLITPVGQSRPEAKLGDRDE
jgi:hypothetical protein